MPASYKRVLLDSNLLLLLVVGTFDERLIGSFKRTAGFTIEDFDSLLHLLGKAGTVLTTPHVLTEVSNLANFLHENQRTDFSRYFREVIALFEEQFTSARQLSHHSLFPFGIADVSMLQAGATLILTEDGRFASQVNQRGNALALDLKTAMKLQTDL